MNTDERDVLLDKTQLNYGINGFSKKVTERELQKIISLVEYHDNMMQSNLNLVASGNIISPVQWRCIQSDLLYRAAEGRLNERIFPGLRYFDEIEIIGQQVLSRMLGDCVVDFRPISGSQANLAVLSALTRPGDILLTLDIKNGGHVSLSGKVHSHLLGIERAYIPWDGIKCDISYSALENITSELHPSVIAIGGSVMLYPPCLGRIVETAKKAGAKTLYDASHTAAFILTGLHDNPIEAGIDVVTFTTCKTIPGPSHAIIASKHEFADKISKQIFPGLVSGGHLNELTAAIVAICELDIYGKEYAKKIIENAQTLGDAIKQAGLDVICDPNRKTTETHQVLLDCRSIGGGARVENILANGGILTNHNLLWWDKSYRETSGVRIGTQEITRLGMGSEEMIIIAKWFSDLLLNNRNPQDVTNEIKELRKIFQKPKYCYNDPM